MGILKRFRFALTVVAMVVVEGGVAAEEPRARLLAKDLVELLSPGQLDAFLNGADPAGIVLPGGQRLDNYLGLQLEGSALDLSWHTVDSGGGSSVGGGFVLVGTVGQPDAGISSGGDLTFFGGFLPGLLSGCRISNAVFCDGFESGDTSRWTVTVGVASPSEPNEAMGNLWSER